MAEFLCQDFESNHRSFRKRRTRLQAGFFCPKKRYQFSRPKKIPLNSKGV
jgi:hypothetical protein